MRRTLKKLVLDKVGENTIMIFYRRMGFDEATIEVTNPMFKGVRPLNSLLKVPIFKYDTGERSYFGMFSSEGIVEK
jgi:hypothetical protein